MESQAIYLFGVELSSVLGPLYVFCVGFCCCCCPFCGWGLGARVLCRVEG